MILFRETTFACAVGLGLVLVVLMVGICRDGLGQLCLASKTTRRKYLCVV